MKNAACLLVAIVSSGALASDAGARVLTFEDRVRTLGGRHVRRLLWFAALIALIPPVLAQPAPFLVKDIDAVATHSDPGSLTNVNGTLYFFANDGTHGRELWKSDGTAVGTVLVKDIRPGSTGSDPSSLTNVNGMLFFSANDGTHGPELWKSDGTAARTVLVKDILLGSTGSGPSSLTNVNGTLFLSANDGTSGGELWKSDGTAVGTVLVKDIRPGSTGSDPSSLTNVNGTPFFSANDGTSGRELWKSDGTAVGTVLVKDILPGGSSSSLSALTNVNGTLFFSANGPPYGVELWKSDGTAAGTVLVRDINTEAAGSGSIPLSLTNVNGTLYFNAHERTYGGELYTSDGTAAGTVLVKDIFPGSVFGDPNDSTPEWLTNVNGTPFFSAKDGTSGVELWKSDGTADGTVLVKDIRLGGLSSSPSAFTNVNGTLFFSANDGTHGQELWKSDGTAAGTVLIGDIDPGFPESWPSQPTFTPSTCPLVFFAANTQASGRELWAYPLNDCMPCNDGDPCTTDSFSPGQGCVYTNNTNPCDDGNDCTSGDCSDGVTCSGTPVVCNDNDDCTTDSCITGEGCVYTVAPDETACLDSDACLVGGACRSGVCTAPVTLAQPAGSPVAVGTSPYSIGSGDFDGDGRPDLAVANRLSSDVSILLGNGAGGFSQAVGSPITSGVEPHAVAVGDLDRDGKLDLAIANRGSGNVRILLGNGLGGFSNAAGSPLAAGSSPESVAMGDLNGDGKLDLVVARPGSPGYVKFFLGNGSGGFSEASGSPVSVGSFPVPVAVGDLNGDGRLDVATADSGDGSVTILLGNGSGQFSPAAGSPNTAGSAPSSVAVGDINGDGKLDLAIANNGSNNVTTLLGNGSGGFSEPAGSPVAVGAAPKSIAVGDLNGDGTLDISAANSGSNNVTVLLGNGLGGFTQATGSPVPAGTGPQFVGTLDVNRDGKLDLAVANDGSNNVTILMNNTIVAPNGGTCSDGSACTTNDACFNGACTGTPSGCASQCTLPPSGLVGWWPAEGIANDISGSGNHGTLTSGETFAPGKLGQAFHFDGVDDYLRVPYSSSLVPGTGSFSIAAWVNTNLTSPTQIVMAMHECGGLCSPGVSNSAYELALGNGSGSPTWSLEDSNSTTFQSVSAPSSVADEAWHHLVARRDMSTMTMDLYVDGALAATSALSTSADGAIKDDDAEADPVTIGAEVNLGSSSLRAFFQGSIDEVMYANRALTAQEILDLYNTGSTEPCRCTDADGDGYGAQGGVSCPNGTQQDCNDESGAVWSAPIEARNLRLSKVAGTTLTWDPQAAIVGSGVTYDLLRGALSSLAAGAYTGSCVSVVGPGPTTTDGTIPPVGTKYWYLVRGHDSCGIGSYGNKSVRGLPGAERVSTTTCP